MLITALSSRAAWPGGTTCRIVGSVTTSLSVLDMPQHSGFARFNLGSSSDEASARATQVWLGPAHGELPKETTKYGHHTGCEVCVVRAVYAHGLEPNLVRAGIVVPTGPESV